MRAFIAVLVLILSLQSWTKADDIRDYEIEGTSIGDSLLKHFSEDLIKSGIPTKTPYKSDKFVRTNIRSDKFKTWEVLQFHFKKNTNYKIHSIAGINFVDDIEDCYNQMREMDKELSILFKNANRQDRGIKKHSSDPTGNSTIASIYYYLKDDDGFRAACFDWSEKFTEEKNFTDHIKVNVFTGEIVEWFANEPYK